jgi:hypothetical protein
MRKRISLLGAILTVMALPLYAETSHPGRYPLDSPSAALHLQIANLLITGTGHFSILDTTRQLNPQTNNRDTGIRRLAPDFNLSNPVVPVPEPAHYVLMGLGVVGLFLARRDRLNAK